METLERYGQCPRCLGNAVAGHRCPPLMALADASFATIRYAVSCWLRYGKQCPIVSFERGGHGWAWNHPDIFAVDTKRRTYDVEIKMSFSDFRADFKKEKFQPYSVNAKRPTWFYYAAPLPLAEKILASKLLPVGAGLLGITRFHESGQDGVQLMVRAEKHDGDTPTMAHMVSWIKDQSGTLCGMAKQIAGHQCVSPSIK